MGWDRGLQLLLSEKDGWGIILVARIDGPLLLCRSFRYCPVMRNPAVRGSYSLLMMSLSGLCQPPRRT
jgi:hypothetical protein